MAQFWQERTVYQIYPRSFLDTDGDGIGDLAGVIQKLPYLAKLGVGIVWLSPVYRSPDADNGYDISDYCDIDPKFGTMADMERLLAEAKKLDIKIVMDLVINHTSDEHPWFIESRDKNSPYRDYYIWRAGKGGRPPNNWISLFGGSAWTLDETSGEYYLHLFAKKQPDLNYHNPKVLGEIEDIMRFWLDKGVSGFRCDVINVICKSSLENSRRLIVRGAEYYTSQPGTHEILKKLRRDVLSRYDCFTVGETVFVTPDMGRELCDARRGELDMIFSFEHMETDQYFVKWFKRRFSPARFSRTIVKWQNALDWNANYLENHDQPRAVSRFADDGEHWAASAKLLAVLLFTLRGTPFVYQGQEIGMTNYPFAGMDEVRDIESISIDRLAKRLCFPSGLRMRMIRRTSRDNARTPMQWTAEKHAGFTDGDPWLRVNPNFDRINAAAQEGDPDSILNFYKRLIRLRAGSETLKYGDFTPIRTARGLFVYERALGDARLRVILNFSKRPRRYTAAGNLVLSNYARTAYDSALAPYEVVVLETGAKA